ncbi:dUTP diphosphatase [Brevundimonas sp. VNH65]|uniref:dUTP diphosphatase n=1 Tax=Brevundimonas sp. VNH65 TaxID=3400917 RepID=UPI003BFFD8EC
MTETVSVQLVRLPNSEGMPLPAYETIGSAGMDLRAAVPEDQPILLEPGKRTVVPTGLKIALPLGYEAQVRARSGLALKHGLICPNAPGTIDSDYRGEVGVLLANIGDQPFEIRRGERVAQLVIARHEQAAWVEVETLDDTARGAGGFGSTGR